MNLKDRMSSGSEIQKIAESEMAPKNPNLNTWKDTMQKSNQQSLDSLVEVQAETIRKQKEALQQRDEKIEALENQIQILSSEKQKLTSVLVETREELSSTQKQNLEIAKENDELRNRRGLKNRKEQQKLAADLASAQNLLSETRKLVDISNVEAVQKAQAAQTAAELKASKDIADYKELADGKVNEAVEAKIEAKKNAKLMVDVAKKRERIAWGSLAATIFCCLVAYPVFLNDLWDAITQPFLWLWNGINDYAYWLKTPYYSKYIEGVEKLYAYSAGMSWLLRITSLVLAIALIVDAFYGIWIAIQYYKKRWCSLSLKVLLISTGAVIVFGETIHRIMSTNLIALLLFIQVAYLGVLIYLDGYFETRNKDRKWLQIQNQ